MWEVIFQDIWFATVVKEAVAESPSDKRKPQVHNQNPCKIPCQISVFVVKTQTHYLQRY